MRARNTAGGDGAAAQAERVVDGDGEAEFAAQGLQAGWAGDAGLGMMTKAEVCAFMDFGNVEVADQDVGSEVAGGVATKLFGEGEDQGGVDAVSASSSSLWPSGVIRGCGRSG